MSRDFLDAATLRASSKASSRTSLKGSAEGLRRGVLRQSLHRGFCRGALRRGALRRRIHRSLRCRGTPVEGLPSRDSLHRGVPSSRRPFIEGFVEAPFVEASFGSPFVEGLPRQPGLPARTPSTAWPTVEAPFVEGLPRCGYVACTGVRLPVH